MVVSTPSIPGEQAPAAATSAHISFRIMLLLIFLAIAFVSADVYIAIDQPALKT
jgi:hypothetical protein